MIRGAVAAVLLAAVPAPPPAPPPVTVPPPIRLDRDTVLIRGGFQPGRQPDGNSVVMAGPDGAIVFDTGRHPAHTQAVADAVAATGRPLIAIVNSHWHLDHVSGNIALKAANPGATVYASDAIDGALTGFLAKSAEGGRAALAKGGLPPATVEDLGGDLATFAQGTKLRPDTVVTGPRDVTLGGRRLSLRLARQAATAGDVWVWDATQQRVLAGDLVTLPAPFLDTACPDGWRKALTAIAAMPFRELVPGHGPVLNRAAFARYRTAFDRFLACADAKGEAESCVAGWLRDAGDLIPAANAKLASDLASYYVELLRSGRLRPYCA